MGLRTGVYRVTTRTKVYLEDAYHKIRRNCSCPTCSALHSDAGTLNPYRPQRLKFEIQTALWPHWVRGPFREFIKVNDCSYFKSMGKYCQFEAYSLPQDLMGRHTKIRRMGQEVLHFRIEITENWSGDSLDNVEEWAFVNGFRVYE